MTALTAAGLTKCYGSTRALQDVDLELQAGEIHALVGENGAGKSTLIKIVTGAVRPDAGRVALAGVTLPPADPLLARARGISCVYQEFTLVPDLSVADNIALGRESGPLLRARGARDSAARRLAQLGARARPDDVVRTLPVAEQQLVEVARALEAETRVLILDEPTATLSAPEVTRLLDIVRRIAAGGVAVLYVSHRFDEVFAIASRITVLRDGRHVVTTPAAGVDRNRLIRWMVGRDVAEEYPRRTGGTGAPVLEVRGLTVRPRVSGVSFSIRAGEVLGFGGLVGAGRTTVGLALLGAVPSMGQIELGGRRLHPRDPAEAIANGITYLTEDRKGRGVFPHLSTAANLTLTHLRRFSRGGLLDVTSERMAADRTAAAVHVRKIRMDQPAGTLSGGTQQKVLFGRLVLCPPAVLILDEPTRGVDVGARAEIYGIINRLCAAGVGILMISSELPELLGMSDRIAVMRGGTIAAELNRPDATPERVMALATGA